MILCLFNVSGCLNIILFDVSDGCFIVCCVGFYDLVVFEFGCDVIFIGKIDGY